MTRRNVPDAPLPYGTWPSRLDAASLFAGAGQSSWLSPGRHGLFFVLGLPAESNAQALMHLSAEGGLRRVSPPGMNLRTRVHEYGGRPYACDDDAVYYSNFSDQRVYRQGFDQVTREAGVPVALTPAPPEDCSFRYADLRVDTFRKRLLCVRERHHPDGRQPDNTLVALPLDSESRGEVLFGDSDFVAAPCLSPDGRRLAFIAWSHPDMPWDHTQLFCCDIDTGGDPVELRQLCADRLGSLLQPSFSPAGDLCFLADWSDWWNLYRIDAAALDGDDQPVPEQLVSTSEELCPAPWQLGQHHYDFVDDDHVVVALHRAACWDLSLLQLSTRQMRPLRRELALLDDVFCHDGRVLFHAATTDEPAAIQQLDPAEPEQMETLFRADSAIDLRSREIARPRHFSYRADDSHAYGLYYPPRNPRYHAPGGTLPPLLVSVHGGPTSTARTACNPALQFWTSRGFAWLDVNHRGSTGYGRRFRHSLYGNWGVVDIEDVIAAVGNLVERGLADPQRIAIRGGSAGGYTVLAALASSRLFRAGVSYYGIADLELLARDTHKFESRYLDRLIGPWPEQAALYRERSPLYRIDAIDAPVLLLQGRLDRVVPPNQAETLMRDLQARNPLTRGIFFDDEGHGFRKPANQTLALESELAFYQEILS